MFIAAFVLTVITTVTNRSKSDRWRETEDSRGDGEKVCTGVSPPSINKSLSLSRISVTPPISDDDLNQMMMFILLYQRETKARRGRGEYGHLYEGAERG